jgi:hypothetical protein
MDEFEVFHKAMGEPEMRVEPLESFFDDPAMTIDEDLVSLWRQDGWARYARGLFWTVDPREFAALHEDWQIVPEGALIFARSAFTDLFLFHDDHIFRFDPQYNRFSRRGSSTSIFLNHTVGKRDFQKLILGGDIFPEVHKRLGDLAVDECYGLFPALPLGGNVEDPKGYQRVKLREYLAILAQTHG